jgi:hypothetical protein
MDDVVEKDAHMALTALRLQNLPATVGTTISLYPIQDLSNPEWKDHMNEASNIYQVHHHTSWTYMAHYGQHLFQLQQDTQRIVASQQCRLGSYAKEVTDLNQEISHMAQENGVVCQQVRDLESHLRDKDEALWNSYRHSSERNQELFRHRVLLRMAEEGTTVKAHELEEFQAMKDQEIENL